MVVGVDGRAVPDDPVPGDRRAAGTGGESDDPLSQLQEEEGDGDAGGDSGGRIQGLEGRWTVCAL